MSLVYIPLHIYVVESFIIQLWVYFLRTNRLQVFVWNLIKKHVNCIPFKQFYFYKKSYILSLLLVIPFLFEQLWCNRSRTKIDLSVSYVVFYTKNKLFQEFDLSVLFLL